MRSGQWYCQCGWRCPNSANFCSKCGYGWTNAATWHAHPRENRSLSRQRRGEPDKGKAKGSGKGKDKAPTFQLPPEARSVSSLPACFSSPADGVVKPQVPAAAAAATAASPSEPQTFYMGTPHAGTPLLSTTEPGAENGKQEPLLPKEAKEITEFAKSIQESCLKAKVPLPEEVQLLLNRTLQIRPLAVQIHGHANSLAKAQKRLAKMTSTLDKTQQEWQFYVQQLMGEFAQKKTEYQETVTKLQHHVQEAQQRVKNAQRDMQEALKQQSMVEGEPKEDADVGSHMSEKLMEAFKQSLNTESAKPPRMDIPVLGLPAEQVISDDEDDMAVDPVAGKRPMDSRSNGSANVLEDDLAQELAVVPADEEQSQDWDEVKKNRNQRKREAKRAKLAAKEPGFQEDGVKKEEG